MRRLIVLAVALTVAGVVVSAASAITAPPKTFADATGDSGTAPDIATIAVTNDDHGRYSFTIGFATPYVNADTLAIAIDSDNNASTGDPQLLGADYVFVDDYASHSFQVGVWQSNDFALEAAPTAEVVVAGNNKSVTMTISKADVGNSTGFNFFVIASDGSASTDTGHTDDAPNGAFPFSYSWQTVFTLAPGTSHDGAAKAGGTWTVSMSAVRSDTKATVGSEGRIACKASEGSKKLAVVSHSFVSSGGGRGYSAVCTFRVPKTPKQAAVHATVKVTDAGQSATKSFAAKTK